MGRTRWISGGIGVALITALGAAAPQMWSSYLDYRREMFAMQQSAEQHRLMALCAESGGKWWKGDCLEVTHGPD